ncbi:MAG: AarF/ABC1/UbiB kinase family protein [Nevskia sp.]|nr:AarF/ABC1/UbiB kinase family protein [Nevskia sp.]
MSRNKDKDKDKDRKFNATTPAKRFFKLAGMTASIASNVTRSQVKKMLGNPDGAEEMKKLYSDIGERLADTLGEMKGAVMKMGQIASQYTDMLPKEVAEALKKLQKESPPMPFAQIEKQIATELGKPAAELFASIDPAPFAAASIGQVHRARTHAGEEVVVKVQYPGVEDCVESDLKHLRMALRMAGLLKVDKEMLDAVFGEIRRSLKEELDYKREADNARAFASFHANDPKIIIPRVFEQFTSKRVLTLAYEPGDHISKVREPDYTKEVINELGHRLFNAMGAHIFALHAVHCDPHPGNFAFRQDGSLVIYDYGCIKKLNQETVENFRKTTRAALAGDYSALELALIRLGVRNTEIAPHIGGTFYAPWAELTLRPFSDTPFDFGHSRLHEDLIAQGRKSLKYWNAFQASPDTLMVNRMLAGHYWTMKELGVNTAFRGALERNLSLAQAA